MHHHRKCSEVMTRNPVCCVVSDTVEDAAQLMRDQDIGPLPVVANGQSKKLVGIVTDRDLTVKVLAEGRDPRNTTLQDVMSTGLVCCSPDDAVQRALDRMEQHQVRRIPVVEGQGRIAGIIAQADVATRVDDAEKTHEVVEAISR